MQAGVYKICHCRDQVKCRHSWWFSFKRRGSIARIRKSLDAVLERHIDSKTTALEVAGSLRIGIVKDDLSARTRELLGLPASSKPVLQALTVRQLLNTYRERHLAHTATEKRQAYRIGAITRTVLPRPDTTSAPFGDWLVVDVTADALDRLRELRSVPDVFKRKIGTNRVGGVVAANRDLRLLRAAFNWALRMTLVERSPFRRGDVSTVRFVAEQARSRRLQEGERDRLLPACGPHLRALVEAALESGCRKGELLGLQWSQVQLDDRAELWLPAAKTKSGKARRVPISSRLNAILQLRRDALRKELDLKADEPLPGTTFMLGNEIGQQQAGIKTAWRLACQRAKIDALHFHDLRRECGSRWSESGVPLGTIQKWLGHTNIAQTSTYLATTTAGEHEAMRAFEQRIGRLTQVDTQGATPPQEQSQQTQAGDNKPAETLVGH